MLLKVLNRVPVRFKDGKTRWITIKGAHVPVGKDGELKGKTGDKIENDSKGQNKRFDLQEFQKRLNTKEQPRQVLRDAARTLMGNYKATLPEYGETSIEVAQDFVRESAKYLYPKGKELPMGRKKEIAQRQLFAMSHFEDILKDGVKTRWTNNPNHHEDYDFITSYKKLTYAGKELVFSVDIKRNEKVQPRAHNLSNSRNIGFREKKKHAVIPIKKVGDGMELPYFEAIRVRCIEPKA